MSIKGGHDNSELVRQLLTLPKIEKRDLGCSWTHPNIKIQCIFLRLANKIFRTSLPVLATVPCFFPKSQLSISIGIKAWSDPRQDFMVKKRMESWIEVVKNGLQRTNESLQILVQLMVELLGCYDDNPNGKSSVTFM